jgi:hypothetical protein
MLKREKRRPGIRALAMVPGVPTRSLAYHSCHGSVLRNFRSLSTSGTMSLEWALTGPLCLMMEACRNVKQRIELISRESVALPPNNPFTMLRFGDLVSCSLYNCTVPPVPAPTCACQVGHNRLRLRAFKCLLARLCSQLVLNRVGVEPSVNKATLT